MKRFLALALAATIGLAFAGTAQAAIIDASTGNTTTAITNAGSYELNGQTGIATLYRAGITANGIKASRHNLGSMGNFLTAGPGLSGTSTSEICVFCHTPHHTVQGTSDNGLGNTTGGNVQYGTVSANSVGTTNKYGPAPLWNRRSNASIFKAYGTTIGGTGGTAQPIYIGGVTLACLSCHDGVTTLDNLVNAPGSGGLQATYGNAGQTDDIRASAWGFMDKGDTTLGQNVTLGNDEARLNIGNGGTNTNSGGFGTNEADLSNDHPMSINYNDGGAGSPQLGVAGVVASLRNSDTTIDSIDLRVGLKTSIQALADNLSQNRWAVKGFISDTATINDLLRNGKVECSSCHDPHFKNLSNIDLDMTSPVGTNQVLRVTGNKASNMSDAIVDLDSDGLFLRRVGGNAGSGVCRTCHNK